MDGVSGFQFDKDELTEIRRRSASLSSAVEGERQGRYASFDTFVDMIGGNLGDAQSSAALGNIQRWAQAACSDPAWRAYFDRDKWLTDYRRLRLQAAQFDMRLLGHPVPCADFLVNQVLVHRVSSKDDPDMDWIWALAVEALAQANPPATAAPVEFPAPQPPPPAPPVYVEPAEPRGGNTPTPPDYNHCIDGRCIHWR